VNHSNMLKEIRQHHGWHNLKCLIAVGVLRKKLAIIFICQLYTKLIPKFAMTYSYTWQNSKNWALEMLFCRQTPFQPTLTNGKNIEQLRLTQYVNATG